MDAKRVALQSVAIAACILISMALPNYLWPALVTALAITIGSIAWAFQYRGARDVSLAYALYYGIGGYAVVEALNAHLGAWVGILVGVLVAGGIAAALAWAMHRFEVHGIYYTFSSLIINLIALDIIESTTLFGGVSGQTIVTSGPAWWTLLLSKRAYVVIGFLVVLAIGIVISWLESRPIGKLWRAIRQDEEAARGLGVDVLALKVLAAGLSAAICSLGGMLATLAIGLIDPNSSIDFNLSIGIMVAAVFGGVSVWWYPIVGAFVLSLVPTLVESYAQFLPPGSDVLVYGVALLIVVLTLPQGLTPALLSLLGRYRRAPAGFVS